MSIIGKNSPNPTTTSRSPPKTVKITPDRTSVGSSENVMLTKTTSTHQNEDFFTETNMAIKSNMVKNCLKKESNFDHKIFQEFSTICYQEIMINLGTDDFTEFF